ncbi:hypothetical protein VNI00_015005 [Paramarasmius palmivorus]|uniref:Uncharacterized protein n=1 Tax=Paramarasmius palmivorus TaxID=297713 RepID=A0AAW0BPR2_9AGAR
MASDTSQVTLILDDFRFFDRSNRSDWTTPSSPLWLEGNVLLVNGTNATGFNDLGQNFTTTFNGTSISFFGSALSTFVPTVTVDQGDAQSVTLPQIGVHTEWYRSPPLSDAEHTIQFTGLDLINIDYSIITAGESTSLSQSRPVVIDDSAEDEIWYRGQWKQEMNRIVQTDKITGDMAHSMNDTLHVSRNIGDSLEFHFAGSDISVYGILELIPDGNFTLEFNLDGTTITRKDYPLEGKYKLFGYNTLTNYKFYENPGISPGNHTLLVNVTAVQGSQGFQLDYLAYAPMFTSVSQKPVFIRSDPETIKSRLPIGAIVGGTVGGTIVLLMVGIMVFWRRKRSKRLEEGMFSVGSFDIGNLSDTSEQMTSVAEQFSTRFPFDSKPKVTKRRPISQVPDFPVRQKPDTEHMLVIGAGSSSSRQPQPNSSSARPENSQFQQRLNEISALSAELEQSEMPTRGELYERIEVLKRENERLMRDYVLPPEYDGSVVGVRRTASRSVTLPSYDNHIS